MHRLLPPPLVSPSVLTLSPRMRVIRDVYIHENVMASRTTTAMSLRLARGKWSKIATTFRLPPPPPCPHQTRLCASYVVSRSTASSTPRTR